MRKRSQWSGLLLAGLAGLLLGLPAAAQDKPSKEDVIAAYQRGEALKAEGKYAEAIKEYDKAVALAERVFGPNDVNTAALLNNLAQLHQEQGQYAQAEPLYKRSLQIRETLFGKDHPEVATSLNNLALLYQKQGQYKDAESLCQRALLIYETRLGKDHPLVANCLNSLAGMYWAQGQYAEAEPLFQRALQIREDKLGKDHLDVANSLNNLAMLYQEQGLYVQAEPLYRRALQIRETKLDKDHPLVANSLSNLAALYEAQAQYTQAEPLSQRALRIAEAKLGKDHPLVANILNNLALLYQEQGQYALAEPLLRRSLQIMEARLGEDHPQVASSLHNLAALCRDQGQYAQAETLLQRAVKISEARLGKDHPDVAYPLNTLALLFLDQRRFAEAEPLFQRVLQIREARLGKDHPFVAAALNSLAGLYEAQGQYAQAEPLYQRALQIVEARLGKDHPFVATALSNLAGLYRDQGQYALAEPLYRRSLQIREAKLGNDHPQVAMVLTHQALLYAAEQHWQKAAAATERARRSLRQHIDQVLPALSEPDQLAFLRSQHDPSFHVALSLALRRRPDTDSAALSAAWVVNGKGLAQQALVERTLLARASQDPRLQDATRELIGVRAQLARLTFAALPPGQAADRRPQLERLARQERDLSRQLGQALGRPVRANPWVELDEVRNALPKGAVLIDVVRFPVFHFQAKGPDAPWQSPHYAAWVIPPRDEGKVQLIDLGEAEPIEAAIAVARRALQDGPRLVSKLGEVKAEQELAKALQDLTRLVLDPLHEKVGQAEQWIVSPDASLWLVPWEALLLPDGRYAIEKYRIRYVVSGRDLVLKAQPAETTAPLVLADPDFDLDLKEALKPPAEPAEQRGAPRLSGALGEARFTRLPSTAEEAKVLVPRLERYAGAAPRLRTGKEAREEVFKGVQRPKVLVLSTHGFFLPDQEDAIVPLPLRPGERGVELVPALPPPKPKKARRPLENPLLRCGLALAGANRRAEAVEGTDDGILTGLEVVGTDLRGCELVVLSACETGLGEVRNGEGVAGLRQAFQLAGARTVVATLWKIPDKETAQLMSAFFENLAAGQGKADALRQAQLAQIKERRTSVGGAHPFYWAAFTLTGQ